MYTLSYIIILCANVCFLPVTATCVLALFDSRQHQPSVRSDRDQLAHRRGLGGLTDTPPAAGPSNGSRRFSWDPPPPEEGVQRSRDYRSRSPEKRGGDHAHPTPPYADTEAERRQEYLKARKERKVKF